MAVPDGWAPSTAWRTELRRMLRCSPYGDDNTEIRVMLRDYPKEYDPIAWRLVSEDATTPGQD